MKTQIKNIGILTISYFLVLLFVYTSVSKLMDRGIFQAQMAQSEMLQPYTEILLWAVPLIELVLAGLLLGKTTRKWGLSGSFTLMLGFSLYVYLIMTYSPSLPCSCGGILQAMDWQAHLYFNIGISLLSGWAWLQVRQTTSWIWPLSSSVGLLTLIVVLFVNRPRPEVLQDESFTRNYTDIHLAEAAHYDLPYNSYYIAGLNDSLVYLGNSTGFTHGLQWNYRTDDTLSFKIQIPDVPAQFASLPKWQVVNDRFYIGDGVTPSFYSGNVTDWTAHEFMPFIPYYSDWVVVDSTTFIIKALQASTQKYVLARYQNQEPYVELYDVLEQEPGNLFQADGKLVWNTEKQQAVHLYFYRNHIGYMDQALSATYNLPLLYSLDHSDFKTNKGMGDLYLRENPIAPLHSHLRLYKENYLVQSHVMGADENVQDFLTQQSIDVYGEKGYRFSFRIPRQNREKARDFYVTDQHIIVLYPTQVVVYGYNPLVMAMNEQEKPNT